MWFFEMTEMQSDDELAELIRVHSRAIQSILKLEASVQEDVSVIPELRSLRLHERALRRHVVGWLPSSRALALIKFRHLFGTVLILKASLDDNELAQLYRDRQRFDRK
jgi:hypothetical protein